jgi:hypothetical protein
MNPIIFLWAHPRSMSTAVERIMRERGDLDCLHEPFLHYYYQHRSKKPLPHFERKADHPGSYEETRDYILARAETSPVFAKDMSYYVIPEILQDVEFCRRIRHCFLIRNPEHAILSYYRLDSEVTLQEVGIEQQWLHLQGLHALGIEDSIVLEAEAVQSDPATSMRLFWQALGLDYSASALSWDQGTSPEDWQYVSGWHQGVMASSGISGLSKADKQARSIEFEQHCRQAPQLARYLQHHLPYYRKLRNLSLTGTRDEL